jgi:citrate lyase synthetase
MIYKPIEMIRPADAIDWPFAIELLSKTYPKKNIGPHTLDAMHRTWVATDDKGKIIGTVSAQGARLHWLAVSESGTATAWRLIHRATHWVLDQGAKAVLVAPDPKIKYIIMAFSDCGFDMVEEKSGT